MVTKDEDIQAIASFWAKIPVQETHGKEGCSPTGCSHCDLHRLSFFCLSRLSQGKVGTEIIPKNA